MSDHDHDDQQHSQGQQGGGPNTGFLDFELPKVMFDEAESVVREAYRELLKDAAKRRLEQRWGERITALANLAVDETMADVDANLEIQALIEARNQARNGLEARIQTIVRGELSADAVDDGGSDSDDSGDDDSPA